MSPRLLMFLTLALCMALFARASDDRTLGKAGNAPGGLSAAVASRLSDQGYNVKKGGATVCEVWLLKNLSAKAAFKPTLNVKYPFQPGQLIGVLQVGSTGEFTDFRGQAVKPGVYTLRYGQQPQDGNHIGTSDLADFLLAVPAAADSDPKPISPVESLHKSSAKAAGGNHPAIFSLLPAESPVTKPTLAKEENNRWVLAVPTQVNEGGKTAPLTLRMVVIGKAEG